MAEETESYRVVSPLQYNGRRYEPGETVALPAGIAEKCIGKSVKLPDDEPTGIGREEFLDTLAQAIGRLDSDDPGNWDKAGKPKVPALKEATGLPLTAADRDDAYAHYQSIKSDAE